MDRLNTNQKLGPITYSLYETGSLHRLSKGKEWLPIIQRKGYSGVIETFIKTERKRTNNTEMQSKNTKKKKRIHSRNGRDNYGIDPC